MHYYKRNIGDYHKKAGRLSMLEHGAYTLLIDACYDREQFPTLDDAIDWTWARTDAEIDAVKFVLSKFFSLKDGVYVQNRIKEDLDAYHQMAETNARIAKEREEKRKKGKQSDNDLSRTVNEACQISHEAPPNHKPLTINQEPIKSLSQDASEFVPDLEPLNHMLKMAGGQVITQSTLNQTLVLFKPEYETKHMTHNQRMAKLVKWIKGDQEQANRIPKAKNTEKPIHGNVNAAWGNPPPPDLDSGFEVTEEFKAKIAATSKVKVPA